MKIPNLQHVLDKCMADANWRDYYPRRIVCPHGYYDPCYWALIAKCQLESGIPAMEERAIFQALLTSEVPMYFLTSDFMQAVAATEAVDTPSLDEIHLPMTEMVIHLPIETSTKVFGWPFAFLQYCIAPGKDPTGKPNGRVLVYEGTLVPADGRPFSYYGRVPMHEQNPSKSFDGYEYEDRTPLEDAYLALQTGGTEKLHLDNTPLPNEEEDRKLPEKLFRFLYKLFLVLNATGEKHLDLQPMLPERPESKVKGRVKDALWSPTWIGKSYVPVHAPVAAGHHASPRLHWRRGHVRRQRYGEGYSLVKTIWIEPTLIGD